MLRLAKRASKLSSSSLDIEYLVEALDFTFFLSPSFAMRSVANVGEEKSLGDGDVCGVLVGGGVGGALIGVPLLANMGITALLLVILLFLLPSPLLVVAPVTITR